MRSLLVFLCLLASSLALRAAAPAGYLFAHMTKADYGHLYYSLSSDGLHWSILNGGKRILGEEFRGHPDLCRGHDGRWYLIGTAPSGSPKMILWHSTDLVTWTRGREFSGDLFNPEGRSSGGSLGAPKLFYDDLTQTYYLTWHTAPRGLAPNIVDTVDESRWSAMRTFVMTSKDLVTFTPAQRLFQYDLATIDVIIRREGKKYYAILKDERYPTYDWPTGKSIRIASADSPLGPWSEPGAPISSNYHEAPTLIPRLDGSGWLLYHEQYPGVQFGLSLARTLDGPWYEAWINTYSVTPEARHGCMIALTAEEYAAILKAYGPPAAK